MDSNFVCHSTSQALKLDRVVHQGVSCNAHYRTHCVTSSCVIHYDHVGVETLLELDADCGKGENSSL